MKIVLIHEDKLAKCSTALYVHKALIDLGIDVFHYTPFSFIDEENKILNNDDYESIPDADLYLAIDDDLSYPGVPEHLKYKSAYWCIDTHRMEDLQSSNIMKITRWDKIKYFKHIFFAQKDMAEKHRYFWLPLACDESIVSDHDLDKVYDWSFVGRINFQKRNIYTNNLKKKYPKCFVGQSYDKDMIDIYKQSNIVLNITCHNDLNMRFFEGLSSGSIFLTNKINNGEDELFGDVPFYYSSYLELNNKMNWILENKESLTLISKEFSKYILEKHNYKKRMKQLLERVI